MGAEECRKAHTMQQTSHKRFLGGGRWSLPLSGDEKGSCDGGDLTKRGNSGNVSCLVAGNDVSDGIESRKADWGSFYNTEL